MNNIQKILFFATIVTLFGACSSNDFNEIDGGLLKNPNFDTNVFTATIQVSQIKESAVQTNGLGGYLLGQYSQVPFGTKSATIVAQVTLPAVNPTFGTKHKPLKIVRTNQKTKPLQKRIYTFLSLIRIVLIATLLTLKMENIR